jgi:hypothetical protein
MPYPNQHAARINSPLRFIDGSFRTKRIANGVSIIVGRLITNNSGGMTVQAYRFDKTIFTADEARRWLKDHKINYLSFEPAKSS